MIPEIRALLLADAAVADLIADRAYPSVRPQGSALPALVLSMISFTPDYHMRGETHMSQRIQIDAYGRTYSEMATLAAAVFAVLSGFRGVQGAIDFQGVFLAAGRDFFDPAGEEGSRVHRRSMDFMIHYRSA